MYLEMSSKVSRISPPRDLATGSVTTLKLHLLNSFLNWTTEENALLIRKWTGQLVMRVTPDVTRKWKGMLGIRDEGRG